MCGLFGVCVSSARYSLVHADGRPKLRSHQNKIEMDGENLMESVSERERETEQEHDMSTEVKPHTDFGHIVAMK